jgi:small GTP-binding protein
MFETPRANRLHISIFGRRNAGKSSIINAITSQDIALVSKFPGTTTDPVYKSMELLPIGPVVIIDTAGLDDVGEIGELRIKRTMEVMDKTDLALLVFTPENTEFSMEKRWYSELKLREIPIIGVINKSDIGSIDIEILKNEFDISFVEVSCKDNKNIDKLKEAVQFAVPEEFE